MFNSDLGNLTAINTVKQEVNVQYGDHASDDLSVQSVVYNYADLNEITLA